MIIYVNEYGYTLETKGFMSEDCYAALYGQDALSILITTGRYDDAIGQGRWISSCVITDSFCKGSFLIYAKNMPEVSV